MNKLSLSVVRAYVILSVCCNNSIRNVFWQQASFGRADSRFIKKTLHIESATCRLTGAEWARQYHAGPRIWTDTYICKDSHGEQESGRSNGFHLDHVQAASRETHSEIWTESKESPPPNLRRRHERIRSQEHGSSQDVSVCHSQILLLPELKCLCTHEGFTGTMQHWMTRCWFWHQLTLLQQLYQSWIKILLILSHHILLMRL